MINNEKSILFACVIGDGYLSKPNLKTYHKGGALSICHSIKQIEYLEYKASLLREITNSECIIRQKTVKKGLIQNRLVKERLAVRIDCTHSFLKELRALIYINDKKKYSHLLNYLDPQGIAIWYMDDGYLTQDKRTGSFSLGISTYDLKENTEEMIDYFKKEWDIEFRLHKMRENQYSLRCYSKNIYKFCNLIKEYIIPSMKYKIRCLEDNKFMSAQHPIKDDDIS